MACAEETQVTERYWTWCKKWKIPYPCRKRRTVTKYRYDFLPWRKRWTFPFRCKYQGCCGASLYEWTVWCLKGTGNSSWNQFDAKTAYFNSIQSPKGDCPFGIDEPPLVQ